MLLIQPNLYFVDKNINEYVMTVTVSATRKDQLLWMLFFILFSQIALLAVCTTKKMFLQNGNQHSTFYNLQSRVSSLQSKIEQIKDSKN